MCLGKVLQTLQKGLMPSAYSFCTVWKSSVDVLDFSLKKKKRERHKRKISICVLSSQLLTNHLSPSWWSRHSGCGRLSGPLSVSGRLLIWGAHQERHRCYEDPQQEFLGELKLMGFESAFFFFSFIHIPCGSKRLWSSLSGWLLRGKFTQFWSPIT